MNDYFGNELEVGDEVYYIYTFRGCFDINVIKTRVTRILSHKVEVQPGRKFSFNQEEKTLTTPNRLIKIKDDQKVKRVLELMGDL